MSELKVVVDYEAFEAVGLTVNFDSDKYLDLLNVAVDDAMISTYPNVLIIPRYDLGLTWKQRLDVDRQDLEAMKKKSEDGHYLPGSNEIVIKIRHGVKHTNTSLRHETKHWADDNAGILVPEMWHEIDKQAADPGKVSPTTALGAILAQRRYRQLPYESRARDFAADTHIAKKLGSIITY